MRAMFTTMAALGICSSVADAQIFITQNRNNVTSPAFGAFNPSLGTLTSATMTITTTDSRELFVDNFHYPADPHSFTWSIDGTMFASFIFFNSGGVGRPFGTLDVPISGSGSGTINPTTGQYLVATGASTFDLDPSFFIGDDPFGQSILVGNTTDTGLFGAADLMLTTDAPDGQIQQYSGVCYGHFGGSDSCNFVNYRLVYGYVPFGSSDLPEPATWAMMLLGFGVVGLSLRQGNGKRTPKDPKKPFFRLTPDAFRNRDFAVM